MVYIGADHRGYKLKEKIKDWLKENNYQFEDVGNFKLDPEDDYPDFAKEVAMRVIGEMREMGGNRGIVICGSGVGVSITANKVPGIRCGLGFNWEQIKLAREHDDINCLALAADFLTEEKVKKIVKIFLETEYSGVERHKRRIKKIEI